MTCVAVEVWSFLLGVSLLGGAVYWVLQRARYHLLQESEVAKVKDLAGKNYGSALLYTSGLLLQNPPFKLPKNLTGQVTFLQFFSPCERVSKIHRCCCSFNLVNI